MTLLWLHFKGNVCVPFNFFLTKKKEKKKKKVLSLQKVVNILESLLIMKSCELKFVWGEGNLICSKLPLFQTHPRPCQQGSVSCLVTCVLSG